jgi:Pentapeptide repeats (8 copies)
MAMPKPTKTVMLVGAAILAVVLLGALAVWLLPSWLTQSPRSASPSEREKAVADARTGVIAFLAVLGGLGGLYYTARTFRVSRDAQIDARKYADVTARMSAKTVDLNERGQITDRYAKAVEMLGDPSYEICIGGIYALGHIMRDSPDYERSIVGVLSAFVRLRAKRRPDLTVPWKEDEAERDEVKPSFRVQAALYALTESTSPGLNPPNLRDSDLRGARMRGHQLQRASFRRSYLHKAKLNGANLSHAGLVDADLSEATLRGADLSEADLRGADLRGADLRAANLAGAQLTVGALTPEQLGVVRNRDKIIWVKRKEEPGVESEADDYGPDPL